MSTPLAFRVRDLIGVASARLLGRSSAGSGRAEELSASQVRTLLDVLTTAEIAAAYQPIGDYATLVGGLVPAGQLPSYVDDVIEGANLAAFPVTGESGKIYVALDTGRTYRWSGSAYVELTDSTAVWGSISGTLSNQTDLQTALNGKANSSHTHTASAITDFAEAVDNEVASLLVAGSGISLTYDDAANTLTVAASGGASIGGSTGSTDNAILRADGTGGATLQTSNLTIDDLFTASPNNIVNYVCAKVEGGTTNVGLALVPKGTGPLSRAVPDGLVSGGNARGADAVDLQRVRGAVNQVASGATSLLVATTNCSASGTSSVVIGSATSSASGQHSIVTGSQQSGASGPNAMVVCGDFANASGTRSFTHGAIPGVGGFTNAATDAFCVGGASASAGADCAFATGYTGLAYLYGQKVFANGRFSANGDAQGFMLIARNRTTNATPTTLFLNGSSLRLVVPAGKVLAFTAHITGISSDGGAVAQYVRKGCIKRVVNTTSLVGSIQTIGTDIEDNASTDVAITADDTNEALQINVTGIAGETWRWVAVVEGVEIAFGT